MKNGMVMAAACGLVCGLSASAHAQSFTGVGDLAGGSFLSEALGVSNDGQTVVGYSESASGQTRAFVWSAGVMTGLPNFGSYRPSVANAISDNGVVVGEAVGPGGTEAFKYNTVNLNFRALGGTVPGGLFGSSAFAVSARGSMVAGSRELSGFRLEACTWEGPSPTGLGYLAPGGSTSLALGMSADGSVVAGGSDGAGGSYAAFMSLNGGAIVALPTLGGSFTEAHAVSDDGKVIVGAGRLSAAVTHAFSYLVASGVMTDLGELAGGADFSDALAVNADGTIVVGRSSQASGTVAMIYDTTHGMRNLRDVLIAGGVSNLAGWTLTRANGISDDGTVICGTGINPSGSTEGWVAVLPPAGPGCPADFDGDGTVDFFDYDAFVVCFEDPNCTNADFDGDGTTDFFDYDAFVVAFETPC